MVVRKFGLLGARHLESHYEHTDERAHPPSDPFHARSTPPTRM